LGWVTSISAQGLNNIAMRSDGTVVSWGNGSASPPAILTNAVAIVAGQSHALALRPDGTVLGWGSTA
jgi:alpha-tubulin suppressor-like RCC1 family protein